MSDDQHPRRSPESNDPDNPKNPPQALAHPSSRRAGWVVSIGALVLAFGVAGLVLSYGFDSISRPNQAENPAEPGAVGTAGLQHLPVHDPVPSFSRTTDEMHFRGARASIGRVLPGTDARLLLQAPPPLDD